jgi:hypothetical protein
VAGEQLHLIGLLAPPRDVERRAASRISRVNVGAELHENRHHVPALGLGGQGDERFRRAERLDPA